MAEVGTDAWWHEWQANETKCFVQNATESLTRNFMQARDTLVLWLGLIAIVALASAELWIGVGGVALVVAWVWFRNRLGWKAMFRLDRFCERFRELLKDPAMLPEDRESLRRCEDSILFPLAVAEHRREVLSLRDYDHVETLYREYCCHGSPHTAYLDPYQESQRQREHVANCKLCVATRRVREHIESALSKFEAAIEQAPEADAKAVRRIIGRRNPEAMFRELWEEEGMTAARVTEAFGKNYRFDSSIVWKEMKTAKKVMAKERGQLEKTYEKEWVTALTFSAMEDLRRILRHKEWDEASRRDSLALKAL